MELKSKYGPRLPQFIEVIQIFISQQIASWHLKEWNSEYDESAWQLLESSFHLVQVAPFGTQVPLFIILFSFNIKKKSSYGSHFSNLKSQDGYPGLWSKKGQLQRQADLHLPLMTIW